MMEKLKGFFVMTFILLLITSGFNIVKANLVLASNNVFGKPKKIVSALLIKLDS